MIVFFLDNDKYLHRGTNSLSKTHPVEQYIDMHEIKLNKNV